MWWLILALACGVFALTLLLLWRKWIAPWPHVEELIRQIGRGETPRTFLVEGGAVPRRTGLALETISARLQELERSITGRESGTQTILSAIQDGLLVVDANRSITLANETFGKLFKISGSVTGASLLDAIRQPTLERLISEALRTGEAARSELELADSQTGVDRHIEVSAVPIKKSSSEIIGAVVLFHDITELKRVDQMRRDFVANVSHELRTPLSILSGYLEMLLDSPKISRDELARILPVMQRHSARLALLVDDLLSLAQLESPGARLDLAMVNLRELFNNVALDWKEKLAAKGLRVVVEVDADAATLCADETRLQEVLHNLLENALKYSRPNGQIWLQAKRRHSEVVLSVKDEGIGIGKEDLPRIFERFFRADKARSRELGGTGLGLAIVKHIAQLHGGYVEAESELGRGAVIRVILPIQTMDEDQCAAMKAQ
ncbi:MAG: PAS domain-containing protein [Chthoniobacterales bacterium]|nr:PAS domain-containing protein [Chthoniobacterales bacterium]